MTARVTDIRDARLGLDAFVQVETDIVLAAARWMRPARFGVPLRDAVMSRARAIAPTRRSTGALT
jgi:hypothetical protein